MEIVGGREKLFFGDDWGFIVGNFDKVEVDLLWLIFFLRVGVFDDAVEDGGIFIVVFRRGRVLWFKSRFRRKIGS